MTKKVLVTGATGFIGRHLVEELSRSNTCEILCLLRNPRKPKLRLPSNTKIIPGDITDLASLEEALRQPIDAVFHCAGYVESKNPELLRTINVKGTENICKICLKQKVKRLVYLSSVAVVSGNNQIPLTENLPYKASNMYGLSKIAAEKKVLTYREKGLPCVILRPSMVYGEGEPHLMKRLVTLIKYRLLPMYTTGTNKLHLVYVKNVVAAMLFSLENEAFLHGTYFVADKEILTISELIRIMRAAIGAKPVLPVVEAVFPFLLKIAYLRKGTAVFFKDRVYDTGAITCLGFLPPYDAASALMRSTRWFIKKGAKYAASSGF
jgi:nucleoside-diphosphate-sugar epimerase